MSDLQDRVLIGIYEILCKYLGISDRDKTINFPSKFSRIVNVNAHGRCDRLTAIQPTQQLARVQVEDARAWDVTIQVAEVTDQTLVTATVTYGAGNAFITQTFEVGDTVNLPVFGSTITVTVTITQIITQGTVQDVFAGEAQVCASITEGCCNAHYPPDHFVPTELFGPGEGGAFSLLANAQAVVGPTRLLHLLAWQLGGTATTLMFFDWSGKPPSATVPPTGAVPYWAIPLPAAPGMVDIHFEAAPLAFGAGIYWALSTTSVQLTQDVSGRVARVDLILDDKEETPIVKNVSSPTGQGS